MTTASIHEIPTLPSPITPTPLVDETEVRFFSSDGDEPEIDDDALDLVPLRRDLSGFVSFVVLLATAVCLVALSR